MIAGKKNYGYGRRLDWAAKQALQERYGGGHYRTVAAHLERFRPFCRWASAQGVKDLRQIDAELVRRYAQHMLDRSLGVAQRQNVISTINVIMRHVSAGAWRGVSPRALAGAARSAIRRSVPPPLDTARHQAAVTAMRQRGMHRAAALADLARHFGVRSEEAVKADLTRWTHEAERHGAVDVQEGTKGGRTAPRWVPLTDEGRAALKAALEARPQGSRNLLAPHETYRAAREGWIRAGREAYAAAIGARGYHDGRAAYACQRYQDLTGVPAPVAAGRRVAERDADRQTREVIAQELGHGRTDVLTAYFGGRR